MSSQGRTKKMESKNISKNLRFQRLLQTTNSQDGECLFDWRRKYYAASFLSRHLIGFEWPSIHVISNPGGLQSTIPFTWMEIYKIWFVLLISYDDESAYLWLSNRKMCAKGNLERWLIREYIFRLGDKKPWNETSALKGQSTVFDCVSEAQRW